MEEPNTEQKLNDDALSNKIKCEFYKKNKTYVFIRTKKRWVYQGIIKKVNDASIILDDPVSGESIITYFEIDILDKHRQPKGRQEDGG